MVKRGKSTDGVFWKRNAERRMIFYWRIGKDKSKDFLNQIDCAQEYITKYVERHPKYVELVMDKTWGELFKLFGIPIHELK